MKQTLWIFSLITNCVDDANWSARYVDFIALILLISLFDFSNCSLKYEPLDCCMIAKDYVLSTVQRESITICLKFTGITERNIL